MECKKCGCESVEVQDTVIDGTIHQFAQCQCCGRIHEQEKFYVELTREELRIIHSALFEAKIHEGQWVEVIDQLKEEGTFTENQSKKIKQKKACTAADYELLDDKISHLLHPWIWGDVDLKGVYEYSRDCEYFKR